MNRRGFKKSGFTLAELLMVVVILGIMGSIAMPKFYPQKEKAVIAEAVSMLSAIRQGELAYKLERGGYIVMPQTTGTVDWGVLGIEDPNILGAAGRFIYKVTGTTDANFVAIATRQNSPTYATQTLNLMLTTGVWKTTAMGAVNQHPFQPKDAI